MDYSNHAIHLIESLSDVEVDRIFPRPFSKRKSAFRLIDEGMTVDAWLRKVASDERLQKVEVSFLTQCYVKKKSIELRQP
jgi:hypothetical protein